MLYRKGESSQSNTKFNGMVFPGKVSDICNEGPQI